MPTRFTMLLILAIALCAVSCTTPPDTWHVATGVAAPTIPGGMAPNLAVGDDGKIYLSWIERAPGDNDEPRVAALRFSALDGGTWSTPRTVATGDDWFVNWADVPSMATLADGTLLAHWLRKSGPATYAYDVVVSRSVDGGGTWSEPVVLHDDGTQTEHGFVSISPADDRSWDLVWLDGRHTGGGGGHGEHGHGGGGPMTLRAARIDRDGVVSRRTELDSMVCDCCPTGATRTGDGWLVAYRDRSDDEIRDISLVRLDDDGWSSPRSLHDDGWLVPACPVNGPALSSDGERTVVAWFTAGGDDGPRVLAAFSADGGRSFGDPMLIGGAPTVGRAAVAMLDDGTAFVGWNAGGALRLVQIAPDGPVGEPIAVAETSDARASGVSRLAWTGDALLVAWTEPGEPSTVRTAFVRRAED